MEGTIKDGYSEITLSAEKMTKKKKYELILEAEESGSKDAYVSVIFVYKSKDNATENSENNKAEGFYVD